MSGGASAKKGGVSSYAYPFTEPANIPLPRRKVGRVSHRGSSSTASIVFWLSKGLT